MTTSGIISTCMPATVEDQKYSLAESAAHTPSILHQYFRRPPREVGGAIVRHVIPITVIQPATTLSRELCLMDFPGCEDFDESGFCKAIFNNPDSQFAKDPVACGKYLEWRADVAKRSL